jgi:nucleotide-binding universal stress UspA family protein
MIDTTEVVWPFLFATDFGAASLHALPYAVSFANRVGTKLILLHVIPPVAVSLHSATTHNAIQAEELARQNSLRRLRELTENLELRVMPEFMAVFGSPSQKILAVAESFTADGIILGLHRSAHIRTASHTPWTTAYEVVRRAGLPRHDSKELRASSS